MKINLFKKRKIFNLDKISVLNSCLVVDDNKQVTEAYQKGLEHCDIKVHIAHDVKSALSIISFHPEINLFFIDLNLNSTNNQTGEDLIKIIKKASPCSVLIAMTGYPDKNTLCKARIAGADDYFVKPFYLQDICDSAFYELKKLNRWLLVCKV